MTKRRQVTIDMRPAPRRPNTETCDVDKSANPALQPMVEAPSMSG